MPSPDADRPNADRRASGRPAVDRGANSLGAAMTWMVSVALFAYLGYLLDDALGTLPLFVIAGALLGVIGGFIHFLANVAPEVLPFGKSGRAADPDSATDPGPTDPGPDDPGPDDAPLDAAGPPKVDPDSTSPPSR